MSAGRDKWGEAWMIVRLRFPFTARFAVVVGSVVFGVNQLDVLLRDGLTGVMVFKAVVTYLVPFCSSNVGFLLAAREGPVSHPPESRSTWTRSGPTER